jgi:thioredoxin reductase (NADPH)
MATSSQAALAGNDLCLGSVPFDSAASSTERRERPTVGDGQRGDVLVTTTPSAAGTTGSAPGADDVRNVIIIGSGPAGYTAALYTARADLRPLVLAGSIGGGGALMTTTEVENFPGFPAGIQGPDLMFAMREQAERFGAEVLDDDAVGVELDGPIKTVSTETATYRAHTVIVATGSSYRYLGLDNEQRLIGRGVSACATCDGFFFKGQDIAVIGGGDSAMEEATFLTKFANTVNVVHRRDQLRASKIMQDRAFANDKIRFVWNTVVDDVLGEEKVSGLAVRNIETDEASTLPVTGMFVAIGHDPRSELFRGVLDMDENGYLLVGHPTTATNVAGVFACGDVVDHIYRQAITAAASGCAAALDAERYLAALEGHPETAQTAGLAATPA